MATQNRKRNKADERRAQLRAALFADVPHEEVWTNDLKCWCWAPRTMPLILQAIRAMSKGKSAAETYFALWCRSLSDAVIEVHDKAALIAAAGYKGPTSERTWKDRVRKLEELGFIKTAPGRHGDISCVLILNPHLALRRLKKKKTPGLDDKMYNTILQEMTDFGMLDFRDQNKTVAQGESTASASVNGARMAASPNDPNGTAGPPPRPAGIKRP